MKDKYSDSPLIHNILIINTHAKKRDEKFDFAVCVSKTRLITNNII